MCSSERSVSWWPLRSLPTYGLMSSVVSVLRYWLESAHAEIKAPTKKVFVLCIKHIIVSNVTKKPPVNIGSEKIIQVFSTHLKLKYIKRGSSSRIADALG